MKANVKWFNDEIGYGYIEYKDNGEIVVCFYNKDNSSTHELVLNPKEKTA